MGVGQSIAPSWQFGPRTEAPTFLISLAISNQRLEVGPDHGGAAAAFSLSGNFTGSGIALTQRLVQSSIAMGVLELSAIKPGVLPGSWTASLALGLTHWESSLQLTSVSLDALQNRMRQI